MNRNGRPIDLAYWSRFVCDQLAPQLSSLILRNERGGSFYSLFIVCGPGDDHHDHYQAASVMGGADRPLLADDVLMDLAESCE